MADTVNLQETEYDTILTQIEVLHETAIQQVRSISTEIKSLCQTDGGFYAEKISEKIDILLTCLETEIVSLTETNFLNSKTAMDDFAEIIRNVDSACG